MVKKKLMVNENLCLGCMRCAIACPEVFAINDSNKAIIKNQNAAAKEDIENAINNCPGHAIFYI